jgi:hypothetical protein
MKHQKFNCNIKDMDKFMSFVFGADDFLRHFPQLESIGVSVYFDDQFYYITENNKIVHDTAFFSQEEVDNCLTLSIIG